MKIQQTLALASISLIALAGCGSKASTKSGSSDSAPVEAARLDLTTPPSDAVTVKVFKGGYGDDFFIQAGKEYGEQHNVKVDVEGDPHMWDRLKPDFLAGNPPDCAWPGWGMDYWALVYDGQVEPMDKYLAMPAYGQTTGTWRDTFDPQLLKLGQYDGKQYLMPYHVNLNGWWYNKTVFTKHGWKPPKTVEELLALAPKMKAAGVAPLTYQGKYPYYMLYGFLYPWVISDGGLQAWNDCQNLKPGAWKSRSMLRAAQTIAQLRDAGCFMGGSLSLDHIQSETEFLKGKAGMIPCGTWLYSEMENAWPPGVEAEFMLPPVYANGKGDPTALMVAIEPFIIPSKAKNKDYGVDYFRYITSKDKALQFVEEKGTLMAIKGLEGAIYPPYLQKPAELFQNAKTKWHSEYRFWYPDLGKEAEKAMAALLADDITPEQFCDRLEAKAEETRNDPKIKKHKVD
ncbi:MAG TPA: extracellular solute-binding protein [Fimbriimonadaceae bacterium]|nr:extracellular solute-binding protein [Fimbriimonadaceae bacterium]